MSRPASGERHASAAAEGKAAGESAPAATAAAPVRSKPAAAQRQRPTAHDESRKVPGLCRLPI